MYFYFRHKIRKVKHYDLMSVTELKDTQDQISDFLENLQTREKLKNKDIRILLDKMLRQYGEKVVNK